MAVYKVTWFFSGQNVGWSESFYRDFTLLSDALALAKSVGQKRMNLCGSLLDVALKYIRVQNTENRQVDGVRVNIISQGGHRLDRCDMPWIGILTDISTVDSSRRSLILRGVPDVITGQPWDQETDEGVWVSDYGVWVGEIVFNNWLLRVRARGTGVLKPIQGLVVNDTGNVVVVAPGHGLATGAMITFFRVEVEEKRCCLRGTHKIVVVDANSFSVRGTNVGAVTLVKGYYRLSEYGFSDIDNISREGTARRKVGRPFSSRPGRSVGCRK